MATRPSPSSSAPARSSATAGKWMVGAEVSEMWAWGDFNALGDELNELRAGFFFTFNY